MRTNVVMAVQALIGGTAVALTALFVGVLMRSASSRTNAALVAAIALAFGAWFGVSSALAVAGEFKSGSWALPLLALSLLVPLAIAVGAGALSASIRRLISDSRVQPGLIAIHATRVIPGAVVLWMVALGILPAVFGIPAGAGDVIVGLVALPASTWMRSGRWASVVAWNLLGIFDLLDAIALGVLTAPGQPQLIEVTPSSAALLAMPVAILPTFAVPIYLLIHVISLCYLVAARGQLRSAPAARLEASA